MRTNYIQIENSIYEYLNPVEKNQAVLVATCAKEKQAEKILVRAIRHRAWQHPVNKRKQQIYQNKDHR